MRWITYREMIKKFNIWNLMKTKDYNQITYQLYSLRIDCKYLKFRVVSFDSSFIWLDYFFDHYSVFKKVWQIALDIKITGFSVPVFQLAVFHTLTFFFWRT